MGGSVPDVRRGLKAGEYSPKTVVHEIEDVAAAPNKEDLHDEVVE